MHGLADEHHGIDDDRVVCVALLEPATWGGTEQSAV